MPEAHAPRPIALLLADDPHWGPGAVHGIRCRSAMELQLRAGRGELAAAVVDPSVVGVDPSLVRAVLDHCPVVLVGPAGWAGEGASAPRIARLPLDPADLLATVARATSAARRNEDAAPRPVRTRAPAPVLAVVEAAGPAGPALVGAVARALAATRGQPGDVLLADWTLDAPHRACHQIPADAPGLMDLVRVSRFGPPPGSAVEPLTYLTDGGYRLLPGLACHHDWVSLGEAASRSVLDAVRSVAELVVVHVDRDLEGEAETGSLDIEDRNVLARTAVTEAALVAVTAPAAPAASHEVAAALHALERFRVPPGRVITVRPAAAAWARVRARAGSPTGTVTLRVGRRPDRAVGVALRRALHHGVVEPTGLARTAVEPERIVPGTLGAWAQEVEGWITPRAPQQP